MTNRAFTQGLKADTDHFLVFGPRHGCWSTLYQVHTFIRDLEGRLVVGGVLDARSGDEAVSTARALVPLVIGACVLQILQDPEITDWVVKAIERVGVIPAGYDGRTAALEAVHTKDQPVGWC